ncbi:predicted protein [Chaetomium globosum CBS 148.51]|uniref:Uncharacterized protein n=1 Tax=Chaetomium globosum (strain ATCC 6205 / CBS 148.51 / DSM 1962 / NBRC 6347 / NRRL 1970) TaxID=306901 RepID=Q2H7C2_CHAGB|nr:uncharacterized protein CHGG_05443 [Chaetomium globosum CBS 148.51]EAQ88824.1 predicted protein [Chaetomium globosum CBS 148.51]
MATPSCPQQTHHLKIDIDFDRILTIIFPHGTWASLLLTHLESRPYHADCRALLDDDYTGGALALVFDSKRCARDWLANSPLWGASGSGGVDAEKSVVIRTRWMHGEFERCLDSSMRAPAEVVVGGSVVPVVSFTAAPAPFAGSDVIGKSVDPYRRPNTKRTGGEENRSGGHVAGNSLVPS